MVGFYYSAITRTQYGTSRESFHQKIQRDPYKYRSKYSTLIVAIQLKGCITLRNTMRYAITAHLKISVVKYQQMYIHCVVIVVIVRNMLRREVNS